MTMAQHNAHHGRADSDVSGHRHHYYRLLAMVVLSFLAMYILMYAMVNSFANIYNNVNQFYMAGLMAAPMALIELALMRSMYRDKRLNIIIGVASILALVVFFFLIRQQAAVTDSQFLRSMIPHHAGAILMCEKSPAQSNQVKELCKTIVSSQESEIRQMKVMLDGLAR
jgi:peptidoglycan/LPS O-acetylase OafA/YrhL